MRPEGVVLPAPAISQGLSLSHRGKQFGVKEFIPEAAGLIQSLGLPRFHGQVDRSHAMTLRLSIDDQTDQDQAPVHGAAEC
jgi:hypothetical protein